MHSISRTNTFDRFEVKYLGEDVDEFAIKFYAPDSPYVSDLNIYLTKDELMDLSTVCRNAVVVKDFNLPECPRSSTLAAE